MYGAQIKFGIARQASVTSWVTAPTSYHGFAMTSEDVGLEKEELISENLIGQFEQGAVYDGVNKVLGTISFEATPRNLLASLMAVVNYSPVEVQSGGLRTHTWLPNTQDYNGTMVKAPISIYKQFSDANSAELFYDAQGGQLELTIAQGQFLRGRMAIVGGTRLSTGIGSMAVAPIAADVGRLFPWNVASITLGGSPLNQTSEITISLNENIAPLYTNNATAAPFKYTRENFREVTVQGTLYMNDRTILNNYTAGTQARLFVTIQNTRAEVQSGYFNQLTIDVPQLKFTQFKPGASGPGEVAVQFTGRGVIDPSSNYALQFTTISTYQAGF